MADVKAEIEITATDKASGEIKDVGKSSSKALKAVKKFGSAGARAFKGLTVAAVGINQGLEVLKKFKDGLMATAEMSMAYRRENDPLIKQFKESKDLIGSLAARVGDVLVNAFSAATNAIGPLIKNARLFLVENQKIIAVGILEFFAKFGQIAVTVVGKSILYLTKVTNGFKVIWQGVKAAVNSVFGFIAKGIAKSIKGYELLAGVFGLDGIAGKLKVAGAAASEMADIFDESVEENMSTIGDMIHEQENLERTVNNVTTAIHKGFGVVASAAVAGVAEGTAGLNISLERTLSAEEKLAEEMKNRLELAAELTAAEDARALKAEERARKAKDLLNAEISSAVAGADAISSAFVSGYGAAEEGQNQFSAAMRSASASAIDMALEQMQKEVMLAAATGGAKAAASWGWAGPVVASGMAAAMFGLIRGFIALGMEGMAEGGLVTGGVSGRDSVPIMAMPGEFVLTKDQTDSLRSGGGGMGSQVVNIELNSTMPQSRTEIKRFVRQNVVPALRDLKAQGMY